MDSIRSSIDIATLSAWRGQLSAMGARLRLRTQLLYRRQELLPRFAAMYRQLRALPRRLRKALQRHWGASLAGVALLLIVQPGVSKAANFTAGTAAELVTAITTANGNGEVDTITLTADITLATADNTTYGSTGLPIVSSAITIAGDHHTIQRETSNPEQFRLLAINASGNLALQDTTLSGGSADEGRDPGNQGGGILNNRGQLTLEGSTITGNRAGGTGGGVAFIASYDGSTVQILNSTVSGNTATYGGGGMLLRASSGSTVQIQNSTVSGNSARNGGGMFLFASSGSTIQIQKSTVSGNTATYGGGMVLGAYSAGDAAAILMNSTVSGNTATYGGGMVLNASYGSTAVLMNSTVSSNSAGSSGGGVHARASDGGTVVLTNSTISGNTAGEGGGVYSSAYGGDLLTDPGAVALSRNLFSGNLASSGAEAFHADLGGSFSVTLNLVGHNGLTTAQALSGVPTEIGNIVATSDGNKPTALTAILDTTLQNNGGPTLTQNLVAGSPAIDTAGATCDLTTDQRGAPRPVDGDGDGVVACDIGAVEFGAFPSALDCSTATASVNFPRLGNRHRYKVDILGVTAPDGRPITLAINSILQDEPVTNPTGTTCPDGIGVGTEAAKVRNERIITSAGDGRVYHIGFTATGEAGASCTGEVQVCVPVNEGEECGDQGALFDSTECP